MIAFTPGPCCAYPNQSHDDEDETIYLNTCDCMCHDDTTEDPQ